MLKYRIKDIMSELRQANVKATQVGMADAAGVPQSYISRIVNNQTKAVDPNILFAIAKYLTGVSSQQFTIASLFDRVETERQAEKTSVPASSVNPVSTTDTESHKTIEQQVEKLNRIEKWLGEMGEQFADIRQEIAGVRTEISKLNQRGGVN